MMKVLLVEDNLGDACLTRQMLAEAGPGRFDMTHVELVSEALQLLSRAHFDIVLQDLSLPDGQGLEILGRVQEKAPHMPIVVLSGCDNEELAFETVRKGAQDYLVKGQGDGNLLVRTIRYAIERKRMEERLTYLVQCDTLTGLANRTSFREHLLQALARGKRTDRPVGLMFLDLDRFKAVNDTFGHDAGDLLLKTAADRLKACVREVDTVARMGGDEFTVLLESFSGMRDISACADRILESLARPFILERNEVSVAASIGIAVYPLDGDKPHDLLKNADTAMYRAKEEGGNSYQFYTIAMNDSIVQRVALERDMRQGLSRREFLLHYQPQLDLGSGRIIGMEALLRWRHPERGLLAPAAFIPLAEEKGLIVPLGNWVLHTACLQNRIWQEEGMDRMHVGVNMSPRQFLNDDLVGTVARALKGSRLDPKYLELELTEGALMGDTQAAASTLAEFRAMGIRNSVDDFGTGQSSLGRIRHLPLDTLKIDQSFVREITTRPKDAAIATAIIALAHSLGLKVIAEGVETQGQLDFLRTLNCDAVQGYLISPPLPVEAIGPWLHGNGKRWSKPRLQPQEPWAA
jgi:diguanylate cyclase (GGDEF)-like protein